MHLNEAVLKEGTSGSKQEVHFMLHSRAVFIRCEIETLVFLTAMALWAPKVDFKKIYIKEG